MSVTFPVLAGLTMAAGLLLRGAWDLWAQSLIHLACAAAACAWLVQGTLCGRLRLPSRAWLGWCAALAVLGAVSAVRSPVRALAFPEWFNQLNALWVFVAVAAIPRESRPRADEAVRAAAWVLVLLSVYQRLWQGVERPPSALVNQNVYAGTILMLAPLAVEKRDWALLCGLFLGLWWAKSAGAWLALFGASAWVFWERGRSLGLRGRWPSLAAAGGAALCLVVIGLKFRSPDALHRWQWWRDALAMVRDRPLAGYGPGAFAYVLPGYRDQAHGGLATLYAHQYYLQTAAECGLPFALLWFGGLFGALRNGERLRRAGALAVLLHSLWDWSLSMPGNLWLFSYLCARGLPEPDSVWEVPRRARLPACVLSAGVCLLIILGVWDFWAADRAKAQARAALEAGDLPGAEASAVRALRTTPSDAEPHLILAVAHAGGPSPEPERWTAVARELEAAAALNPYRAQTWRELSAAYLQLGDADRSRQALARGAVWCARLKGETAP